jgi:hypothetical protein
MNQRLTLNSMKPYFKYLIGIPSLLIFSCVNRQDNATTEDAPYKIIYATSSLKEYEFTQIDCQADFENDTIRFYTDDNILLNEIVTTDDRIGFAYSQRKTFTPSERICFQFNNYPKIVLDSISFFPYLFIYKKDTTDKIILEFSTVEPNYK